MLESTLVLAPGAYAHGLWNLLHGPARSRDQIVAFQNERLRRVARSAWERVPFYRRRFGEAGITPEDIHTVDDLPKLPLITRSDIQFLEPSEICAEGLDPDKLLVRSTSGSTGAPLKIRRRWLEERVLLTYRLRALLRLAGGLRTRRASILDIRRDAHWGQEKAPVLHEKLGFIPRMAVDWKLPKDEIVRRLEAFRPDVLHGTPSVLSWVADEWTAADRDRVRPKYVTCGAETLTPEVRQRIEQAFGARARDGYGSHEFVCIAHECLEGGAYHIYEEAVAVEVLKDGQPAKPGEEGVLVGTALHSFAMPFLRYVQGDLVVRGPDTCRCGAPCSTLLKIRGRVIDKFTLPSGRAVHPYLLSRPLRDGTPWIRRFQIVQLERGLFRIRIVPRGAPTSEELEAAAKRVEDRLSGAAKVEIELVDELPPGESGKFYPYVSYERLQVWRQSETAAGAAGGLPDLVSPPSV